LHPVQMVLAVAETQPSAPNMLELVLIVPSAGLLSGTVSVVLRHMFAPVG